jgi:hypothetical protein
LPEHLNRVLVRLSSLRATGVLPDEADPHIDAVSAELDTARHRPGGLRGDERRAALDRLARLDAELLATVVRSAGSDTLRAVEAEAVRDLAPFRATMGESAFAQVLQLARDRVLRERLGLPVISLI